MSRKTLILHLTSRWIFFYELELCGLVPEKYTPTVTSRSTPRFGGVCEQNVMVFEARKPSQDGMEDGFFLLAIARHSSME